MNVYVDGSFRNDTIGWGFVVVENDKPLFGKVGRLPEKFNKHRQIGGELKAVMEAVSWAKRNSIKITIYYDYSGIENWANGEWGANNFLSISYSEWMQRNLRWVAGFVKVKSHSGNKWNDYIDQLIWQEKETALAK